MKRKLTCLAAFLLAANCIVPVSAAETELLHSGFEDGLSGWQARGGASVAVSSDAAAEGSASALVSNRSDAWNGISYAVGVTAEDLEGFDLLAIAEQMCPQE